MSKFNAGRVRTRANGPITAEATPSGTTYEGGPGYAHDAKSELFLLAVTNMVGEDTFYEKAGQRDSRYGALIRQVAVQDSEWMTRFLAWLRDGANMRSASLVGALEAAAAMVEKGIPGGRQIVNSVLQRADEPGEAIAYWTSNHGRRIPMAIKRGIADAAKRLYTERSLLKYDTASHGVRFADVLELTHPDAGRNSPLFKYAIDHRHGRDVDTIWLNMIKWNAELRHGRPERLLDPTRLRNAGMTWEDALSLGGQAGLDKKRLWEAMIPSMGYMALLRNLRNFDEAGVSDAVAATVAAKLADPEEVAKSRQFPYRFLAAYEQAPSLRWGHALDKALQLSLANLPELSGRTLILVDTSGSMQGTMSGRSQMSCVKAAAVFGVALAAKGGNVDLYGFGNMRPFRHDVKPGASVIREVDRFIRRVGEAGHGTDIAGSLKATFSNHDRVVLISDMQTMGSGTGWGYRPVTTDAVPRDVALYGFNLRGYSHTAYDAGSRNRHEFGGLTDATFRMIPLLEAGRDAAWPF